MRNRLHVLDVYVELDKKIPIEDLSEICVTEI